MEQLKIRSPTVKKECTKGIDNGRLIESEKQPLVHIEPKEFDTTWFMARLRFYHPDGLPIPADDNANAFEKARKVFESNHNEVIRCE
ncbi:unnamed protein product [Anisakis simplex]|uniref:DUF3109 family protein n=1 Tax=Anisakis simplex TaxID=6269 RepID=A0A0M3JB83_ANISI|nr:unnamed protein product [Anisakis simplex]